jgi:hypothetical protein
VEEDESDSVGVAAVSVELASARNPPGTLEWSVRRDRWALLIVTEASLSMVYI